MFDKGRTDEITKIYEKLSSIFFDRFYLEIQRHGDQNEVSFEKYNLDQSSKLEIPIIATNEVFGTVEAVKTVSDLFMPLSGKVIETNSELEDRPELVNEDPYGEGWIIKIDISDISESSSLLSYDDYKNLVDS